MYFKYISNRNFNRTIKSLGRLTKFCIKYLELFRFLNRLMKIKVFTFVMSLYIVDSFKLILTGQLLIFSFVYH